MNAKIKIWKYKPHEVILYISENVHNPYVLFIVLLSLVFIAHMLVMGIDVPNLFSGSYMKFFVDTILLILVIYPGFYFLFFRNMSREIKEKRILLKALHKSEDNYHNLSESINEGVGILDVNEVFLYANKKMCELLGYKKSQLIGKKITSFLDVLNEDIVKRQTDLRAKGIDKNYELEIIRRDGERRNVLISPSPLFNEAGAFKGSIAVLTDITDLKEAEQKLKTLLNTIPIPILSVDKTGMIIKANPNAVDYFYELGYEQLINSSMQGILSEDMLTEYAKHISDLKNKEISQIEYSIGTDIKRYIREQSVLINFRHGSRINHLSLLVDITKIKETQQQLNIARINAEKSDRLKSEFLAKISHEIRTPLNFIINSVNMIWEDIRETHPDYVDDHRIINEEISRITNSFDSMLELSELLSGQYEITLDEFDLFDDVLKVILNKFSAEAEQKGIQIVFPQTSMHYQLMTDRHAVTQVLKNLIENAVKFTEEGFLEIRVRIESNFISIEIIDTGPGITKEYFKEIFDPFSQEDNSYTRKHDGNGLGLTIVREFCRLLKIDVSFMSRKGLGTTFIINIPI
ncbi:MAG: PAS domain-containing sensor histidine kinase [Bacteroidetes bacterium]|nr:PAS domain-containing sensor histidine kinase [Bacteroidota bacterium]